LLSPAGRIVVVALVAFGATLAACGPGRPNSSSLTKTTSTHVPPTSKAPSEGTAQAVTGVGEQIIGTKSTATYCDPMGVPETLDLYEPLAVPSVPVPVIVWVHGGGWSHGSSSLSPSSVAGQVEFSVVQHGWVFASINYRLAPQYKWPAQIEDTKCAIRFLRAEAHVYHIDPNRIGAIGASAGGHLVSMLGLAGQSAGFDVGQYLQESSAVEAVVDEFGPEDLTSPDWAGSQAAEKLSPEVFGVPFGQPSAVLTAASPVTYIAPGAPPYLVQQGIEDQTVPPDQSEMFVRRLHASNDSASLQLVQNAGHGFNATGTGPVAPSLTVLAQQAANLFFEKLRG